MNDVVTFSDWSSQTYVSLINEIGYDWKAFAGMWNITDSLVYVVKSKTGDIWKLVFTGFGGASSGNYIFSKEKLSSTGIVDSKSSLVSITLFPNPSDCESVNLICNFESNFSNASFTLTDLSGRTIQQAQLQLNNGLQIYAIATNELTSGLYIVTVNVDGQRMQQKLIIK